MTTPLDTYKKGIESLKSLIDDNRTGLKESSDTNKTRQSILAVPQEIALALLKALREEVEKEELAGSTPSNTDWENGYNQALADTLTTIDTLISNIEKHD